MCIYQIGEISTKIERSQKIKDFGLGRLPTLCYYTSRGKDSSSFVLFSTLRVVSLCFLPKGGCLDVFSSLRGLFGCVFCPKGLFVSDFRIVGNAALF